MMLCRMQMISVKFGKGKVQAKAKAECQNVRCKEEPLKNVIESVMCTRIQSVDTIPYSEPKDVRSPVFLTLPCPWSI